MQVLYREDRATQAAARLLSRRGDSMSYMKLIKLLYFADRRALLELGRPITFDRFVSMPHGPVLSRTCDLITGDPDPKHPSYWRRYISEPSNYEVRLLARTIPNDQLSPAEERILDAVFDEYGHLDRWTVVREAHKLPEYRDPHGSSIPIELRDILMAEGMTEEEAKELEDAIVAEERLERIIH